MFVFLLLVIGLGVVGWLAGRARALALAGPAVRTGPAASAARPADRAGRRSGTGLNSLPGYHGWFVALAAVVPALLFAIIWQQLSPSLISQAAVAAAGVPLPSSPAAIGALLSDAREAAQGVRAAPADAAAAPFVQPYRDAIGFYGWLGIAATLLLGFASGAFAWTRLTPQFRARSRVERLVLGGLLFASLVAIVTTIGIVASLMFETFRFFSMVSPLEFLFGTDWNPQNTVSEPVGDNGYGAVPLFWGTIFIGAFIAMLVAIPLGLMTAVYLTQYAAPKVRAWMKPVLEVLAGVPTVVYGYFAALTVAPALRDFATMLGIPGATSESALAAGLVMGVMIIPFVSSMADDSIAAVPNAMRDGSLAMGATKSETIKKVLIPAALPGVVGGVLLAISRAIGETMIVVMAAGYAANITANPFASLTTVTVQIVSLLTGDQEFDSPKTLAAFALGFVLFVVTLLLNLVALSVVKRYREAYE